jgi:hypothetical protein
MMARIVEIGLKAENGRANSAACSSFGSNQTKEDAGELAAMIHHALSQIEGCPQRGIKVTVYGLNPWNAMLTFGVDSGPVPNKADLQALSEVFTERLKRLYDYNEAKGRIRERARGARAEGGGVKTIANRATNRPPRAICRLRHPLP